MDRRKFIQYPAAGVVLAATANKAISADYVTVK